MARCGRPGIRWPRIAAELLAIGDDTLERDWRWRPSDTDDVELRYGFYAVHERLERAIGTIEVGRAGAPDGDLPLGPAVPALGGDDRGALGPPRRPRRARHAETWDADPGGGEWTVRQTMGHIVSGQLSYSWYNAWYLSHPVPVGLAERPSDDVMPPEPTEEELATAPPPRSRRASIRSPTPRPSPSRALDAASLDLGARWAGLPVSIADRLGRYGSHIREHTIQVDKTLAMLRRRTDRGRTPRPPRAWHLRPARGGRHRAAGG